MTEETENPKRRRRRPAEIKADLQEKIREVEQRERVEALRLVAHGYDKLQEAASLECMKPHSPTLSASLKGIDAVISALRK